MACNVPNGQGVIDGMCRAVPAGLNPHGNCAFNLATCQSATCNGAGSCSAADGASCGPSTCGNAGQTDMTCKTGACQSVVKSCNGFTCNGALCWTFCFVGSDLYCDATHYCVNGTQCMAKGKMGDSCTAADQCVSGTCTAMKCA
jgi:hypothetical protein